MYKYLKIKYDCFTISASEWSDTISKTLFDEFTQAFQLNPYIDTIDLSGKGITSSISAMHLNLLLLNNPRLCEIRLSNCNLTTELLHILAPSLKAHPSIRTLKVDDNSFYSEEDPDSGAKCLADILKESKSLQHVYFHNNILTDHGAIAFLNALEVGTSIHKLSFDRDNISFKIQDIIDDYLLRNQAITKISEFEIGLEQLNEYPLENSVVDDAKESGEHKLILGPTNPQQTPISIDDKCTFQGISEKFKFKLNNYSDQPNHQGKTPLLLAAEKGSVKITELLLEAGADSEVKDNMGRTPLLAAAEYGFTKIVEKLLAYNYSVVDEPDSNGNSPLLVAAKKGWFDIVNLLIEHYAFIDQTNNLTGDTSLHMAIKEGRIDVISLLISNYGANLDLLNKKGETALEIAAKQKNNDVLELLEQLGFTLPDISFQTVISPTNMKVELIDIPDLKSAINRDSNPMSNQKNSFFSPKNQHTYVTNNSLFIATKKRDVDLIIQLIVDGADLNELDNQGENVLHLAIQLEYEDIVSALLVPEYLQRLYHNKVDDGSVKTTNYYVNLFLIKYAFKNRDWDSVIRLIDNSNSLVDVLKQYPDLNQNDNHGNTLIFSLAKFRHENTFFALIKYGSDINHINNDGKTVLHIAVENRDYRTTKMLMSGSPNILILDKSGMSPLQYADKKSDDSQEDKDILITLLNAPAISVNYLKCYLALNHKDHHGRTLIFSAAKLGLERVLFAFLEAGCGINDTDKYGKTIAHIAAGSGHSKLLNKLRLLGAKTNIRDHTGKTPYDLEPRAIHRPSL